MMNPWILQDMAKARVDDLRREAARHHSAARERGAAGTMPTRLGWRMLRGPALAWRWLASGVTRPLKQGPSLPGVRPAAVINLVEMAEEQARFHGNRPELLASRE